MFLKTAPSETGSTPSPLFAFSREDRKTALLCFLIALITFWVTAMPNIGLGDDGEMATAALHMGVPHPSGYPLWTILGGLFAKFFPFGNGAWKLNLFSGLCAASAVALFALLARSTVRWLGMKEKPATLLSLAGALTFAWSVPLWSQATIGKGTYSLHVLLMLALTSLCYLWIRTPSWKNAFVWIVFAFSLGMSNHHMTLAMAILPLLVILLLHGDLFWEYTVYSLLIGSALYLGFAALSTLPDAMKTAFRLFLTMSVALIMLIMIKKKLTEWKRGLLLILAVFLGLLPYLYMPLASSTNPPMNWSYTSTREGFFYAINRSQYWGTLADQLQNTFGKFMGVPPPPKPITPAAQEESAAKAFFGFFKRFCRVLVQNISPFPLLAAFGAFFFYRRQLKEQKIWLILLTVGFFLAAFFEPIMAPNGYDNTGWDMQKPWQGLCYGFLLLLACYGTAMIFQNLPAITEKNGITKNKQEDSNSSTRSQWALLTFAGLVCCYTFYHGLPLSSQRGHWFGWMYGHDMLNDLPPDSFFFGGTDPGRFVPTYMIFGESFEKSKRDPNFDRRDLYIVTQNALADNLYNHYIRSQYTYERPSTFNWFERWLGRDHVYPQGLLVLPHREEIIAIYNDCIRSFQQHPNPSLNPQTNPAVLNTAIAQWIFLNNRDQHRFFVEESFPMPWSYPYAIPHGLCYEINHDPVTTLSPTIVAQDQKFWTDYIERLKKVNGYKEDELARHSFAKLRNTTGNIYSSRNMLPEAEFAYKQALELWPGNSETTENLVSVLTREERLQDAADLAAAALPFDPDSKALQKIQALTQSRLKANRELAAFQQELTATTKNRALLGKAIQDYLILGAPQKADQLVQRAMDETPQDAQLLRDMINFYATQGRFKEALGVAQRLQKVQPNQWDVPYTMAKYEVLLGQQQKALVDLRRSIQLGGKDVFQAISREQIFQQLNTLPEFQDLTNASSVSR